MSLSLSASVEGLAAHFLCRTLPVFMNCFKHRLMAALQMLLLHISRVNVFLMITDFIFQYHNMRIAFCGGDANLRSPAVFLLFYQAMETVKMAVF
jgi:hypothetical protein